MNSSYPPLPLSNIDVAVLVGGLGTRLRPIVRNIPKPLAPVSGKPFLFYLLDRLNFRGARSITLCSGYMADYVREKVGNEWLGTPVYHSVETEPMGTAGALALAKNILLSERVMVMNGDTWLDPDFCAFAKAAEGSEFCIAAAKVPDSSRYGILEWGSDSRLISFNEKSRSQEPGYINAGVYFISQNLLASLCIKPHSLEKAVLPSLTLKGSVKVFPTDSPFLDMGVPKDYAAAADFLLRQVV